MTHGSKQRRKRKGLHEHDVKTQRIRRAAVLENPYVGGGGLKRELGSTSQVSSGNSHVRENMAKAWALGLRASKVYKEDTAIRFTSFAVDFRNGFLYAGEPEIHELQGSC